jgi:hypothetical protein
MRLQEFIHSLEQGGLAKWIRFLVIFSGVAAAYTYFVFVNFHGITEGIGMDQAQIAREIAKGHGFATKYFRPLQIEMFKENKGGFPLGRTPDVYHAPLNPLINSLALRLTKSTWPMTQRDIIYPSDRMIATVAVIFMVLGVWMNYLTARRIFDERIAELAAGLTLVCNQLWVLSLTGLPQMLMFFLFSCCTNVLFRAIEAKREKKPTSVLLAVAGFLFGLLALAHGLTIWIFLAALVFSLLYFSPRWKDGLIMLAVFVLVYSPWLVRNYRACGNPLGMSHWTVIGYCNDSESDRMRSQDTSLGGLSLGALRGHVKEQFIQQTSGIFSLLGGNVVAPVFFLALLHLFKRKEAADFRWLLFLMWLGAFLGMLIMDQSNTNNLYILFLPMLTLYGFAYVMMLWSRLDINIPLLRYSFITIIYLISGFPLLNAAFLTPVRMLVNWPPYVPPFIAILNTWTTENEVIASDMPWAVAWYADRKSLLIPVSMSDFLNLYDWSEFTGNLVGLYLTPVTGNRALVSEILKGEDKDWAPLVLRNMRSKDFPFHAAIPLPIDSECVFYCESDRWSQKAD